jgi:hypothetical protein
MQNFSQNQFNKLQEIEKLYKETQKAIKLFEQYYTKFQQLKFKKNFIDNNGKQRLQLFTWLHKLQKDIPTLKYTIGSPAIYKIDSIVESDIFKLNETPIQLNLELLHEDKLFELFDKFIQEPFNSVFSVKSCNLKRNNNKISVLKPNLSVSCVLSWYMVNLNETNN